MIKDLDKKKLDELFANTADPNLLYEAEGDDVDQDDQHHHHHNVDTILP